jgi:hypothetical protein
VVLLPTTLNNSLVQFSQFPITPCGIELGSLSSQLTSLKIAPKHSRLLIPRSLSTLSKKSPSSDFRLDSIPCIAISSWKHARSKEKTSSKFWYLNIILQTVSDQN